jgi:hypothetical protein
MENNETISYSEENIPALTHIEAIRKRPAMYIGSLKSIGVLQIMKFIYDFANQKLEWKHSSFSIEKDVFEITFDQPFEFEKRNEKYLSLYSVFRVIAKTHCS